jgi:hypothetical protein
MLARTDSAKPSGCGWAAKNAQKKEQEKPNRPRF